jgi:hypothetical protein
VTALDIAKQEMTLRTNRADVAFGATLPSEDDEERPTDEEDTLVFLLSEVINKEEWRVLA